MRCVICVVAVVLGVLAATVANADLVGTYVDATPGDNTLPGSAFSTVEGRSDTDNLWTPYAGFGFGRSDSMIASQGDMEDSPLLTTTVSGLENGTYNVYAIYEAKPTDGADWQIQAAISGQPLVTYNGTSGTATGTTWQDGALVERQVLLGNVAVSDGTFAVDIDDWAGTRPGNEDFRTWYDGVSYVAAAPSPEPSSIALLITGLLGLLAYAWRKRR
jgi:hypothetical protein